MSNKKADNQEAMFRVNLWVSKKEYAEYQKVAKLEGRSFSNWSRTLMNKETSKPKYSG